MIMRSSCESASAMSRQAQFRSICLTSHLPPCEMAAKENVSSADRVLAVLDPNDRKRPVSRKSANAVAPWAQSFYANDSCTAGEFPQEHRTKETPANSFRGSAPQRGQ